MRKRVVAVCLAAASFAGAAMAVRALMIGVVPGDPWLFPLLVVLPGLAAIGLALALLRGSAATRASVVMLLIAVGVAIYAVEAVLQALPDPPPPSLEQVAHGRGLTFDGRKQEQVAIDLRAAGTPAWVTVPANTLRNPAARGGVAMELEGRPVVPLANLADRLVVHCNESGRFSIYRTDEHGYNNPPGLWRAPVDVALVGDSFVHGACVDPDQTLAADIRQRWPKTIGAGLDDFGPLSMLGVIREYFSTVRPRDVFWFYFEWNDLRDLTRELRSPALRQYLEPGGAQHLVAQEARIDSALASWVDRKLVEASGEARDVPVPAAPPPRPLRRVLAEWFRLYRLRDMLALTEIRDRVSLCCDLATFETILRRAQQDVAGWGGRLHFVYLPAALRYQRPMSRILDDEIRARGRVLRLARRLGLDVVDVHAAFLETGDPKALFFGFRSHYTPAGYRVAAEAVLRHIDQRNP
jgi:hypothetical protein